LYLRSAQLLLLRRLLGSKKQGKFCWGLFVFSPYAKTNTFIGVFGYMSLKNECVRGVYIIASEKQSASHARRERKQGGTAYRETDGVRTDPSPI
jgi:hypothetical protein